MIFGTQVCSQASAEVRPTGRPSTQGPSCPSSHRFGVMYDRFGVVAAEDRSDVSPFRSTTCWAQDAGLSMMEWKYMNGSWRVAYWSPTLAFFVGCGGPRGGGRARAPTSSPLPLHPNP